MSMTTEDQMLDFVREQVARRTSVPLDSVSAESEFATLGLQSIDAVLLSGEIEDAFSVELDPADIFEHDTLGEFVRSILERTHA